MAAALGGGRGTACSTALQPCKRSHPSATAACLHWGRAAPAGHTGSGSKPVAAHASSGEGCTPLLTLSWCFPAARTRLAAAAPLALQPRRSRQDPKLLRSALAVDAEYRVEMWQTERIGLRSALGIAGREERGRMSRALAPSSASRSPQRHCFSLHRALSPTVSWPERLQETPSFSRVKAVGRRSLESAHWPIPAHRAAPTMEDAMRPAAPPPADGFEAAAHEGTALAPPGQRTSGSTAGGSGQGDILVVEHGSPNNGAEYAAAEWEEGEEEQEGGSTSGSKQGTAADASADALAALQLKEAAASDTGSPADSIKAHKRVRGGVESSSRLSVPGAICHGAAGTFHSAAGD